jgi:hypothetical protein
MKSIFSGTVYPLQLLIVVALVKLVLTRPVWERVSSAA